MAGTGEKRVEAMRLADVFRARVVDTTLESFVFEITGAPDKVDAFIALMRPLGARPRSPAPASPPSPAAKPDVGVIPPYLKTFLKYISRARLAAQHFRRQRGAVLLAYTNGLVV